nr:unnamed protein product [Callosobruchus chinensis]
MNTFRRLQQLLERSSDVYSEPGSICIYFSLSNLLTLYKAWSIAHISGELLPLLLFILDAVHRRANRLIGDPALSCRLQPLSQRRAVGDLSLFYRYSDSEQILLLRADLYNSALRQAC